MFLSGSLQAFAGPKVPVYELLADLVSAPPGDVVLSTPAAVDVEPAKFQKPPCVPSQALVPGRAYLPVVSDERRVRAIDDLLADIAVCKTMPYDNDGIVHTDPHQGLPGKPAGYYKEYTLIIPGRKTGAGPEAVIIGGETYMTGSVLSSRGPERLMIGDGREVYYTPDHYKTFVHLTIVR